MVIPRLEKLMPDIGATLPIDRQTGTMQGVQGIRLDRFSPNFLALASEADGGHG